MRLIDADAFLAYCSACVKTEEEMETIKKIVGVQKTMTIPAYIFTRVRNLWRHFVKKVRRRSNVWHGSGLTVYREFTLERGNYYRVQSYRGEEAYCADIPNVISECVRMCAG